MLALSSISNNGKGQKKYASAPKMLLITARVAASHDLKLHKRRMQTFVPRMGNPLKGKAEMPSMLLKCLSYASQHLHPAKSKKNCRAEE